MSKKNILVLLVLILSLAARAQDTPLNLLGKVVDSATGLPLSGASAFCPNTTYGTISNSEGLFFLRLPKGGYDLVVSYTGYDKKIYRLSSATVSTDTLLVLLVQQDKSLEAFAVVGSNEVVNGWEKYGSFFLDHFIGTTPNAGQCHLLNPEALRFFYTRKRNRLKVTAKEDLMIENRALGYKIRYQLDSFTYEYNTDISQYTGYPLFSTIDSTETAAEQFEKNRARTYLGSRLHFMRSYYDSTVAEEGFIVEKLNADSLQPNESSLFNIYDPEWYKVDSNEVQIGWEGKYRVSFKPVFPDKKFLLEFKLAPNTRYQTTLLDVPFGFVIQPNGYFYEQFEVINTGYWAWKKIAEALPYDYEYE